MIHLKKNNLDIREMVNDKCLSSSFTERPFLMPLQFDLLLCDNGSHESVVPVPLITSSSSHNNNNNGVFAKMFRRSKSANPVRTSRGRQDTASPQHNSHKPLSRDPIIQVARSVVHIQMLVSSVDSLFCLSSHTMPLLFRVDDDFDAWRKAWQPRLVPRESDDAETILVVELRDKSLLKHNYIETMSIELQSIEWNENK